MAQIIWTEPALSDLNDIAAYIALDNLAAAQMLVSNVFNAVDRLAKFPDSGKEPAELPNTGYQELVVNPCRIFYKHVENTVFIVYVNKWGHP